MSKNVKIFLDKNVFFPYIVFITFFVVGQSPKKRGQSLLAIVENNMISSGLMTIEDLADYLKVTRRTIYDWLKHNKIPAVKLVGQWRFKKDKIDAWLDSHSQHN